MSRRIGKTEFIAGGGILISCAALAVVSGLLLERQGLIDSNATPLSGAGGTIQLVAEITATPTPENTATATSTLAPISTLAPTGISTPVITRQDFMARDSSSQPIEIDRRDAWNSLTNFDLNSNDQVNPDELLEAPGSVSAWFDGIRTAYLAGTLVDQDVTTFEKIAEIHGIAAENFDLNFNWLTVDDSSKFSGELNTTGGAGILTTGDRLSETMVKLADELAGLGRLKNPTGLVMTSDQIYRRMTSNLNLEGKWRPGINPLDVDEIRQQCFTVRADAASGLREDQPEIFVRTQWDQELRPGVEIKLGQEWVDGYGIKHFSNDGLMAVVVKVVPAGELPAIKAILEKEEHTATVTRIAEDWYAVTMQFDLSERIHSPADAINTDADRGSGGQLLLCGSGPGVTPEATMTKTATLTLRPEETAAATPPGTPGPGETPVMPGTPPPPPETPGPTSTPGVTEAPTITPQAPIETATPGPVDAVPPTPVGADTPTPAVAPEATYTNIPGPSSTPFGG